MKATCPRSGYTDKRGDALSSSMSALPSQSRHAHLDRRTLADTSVPILGSRLKSCSERHQTDLYLRSVAEIQANDSTCTLPRNSETIRSSKPGRVEWRLRGAPAENWRRE